MSVATAQVRTFTAEQLDAIQRREGDLFLDAAAGSGKTSVLVERFVRAVLEDGVDVAAILTITFTDKAAAEMRERIRARLRSLGAADAARATEGAYISTIHGFCARMLRAHSLAAGIDPAFKVLDELEAGRLADVAFEAALSELAEGAEGAVDLIAAYGPWDLRMAIQSVHGELRSRGEPSPRLPSLGERADLEAVRRELGARAAPAAAELAALPDPSQRVVQALARLERVRRIIATPAPWPGDLACLRLPGGNGAGLTTPACVAYGDALERFRAASEQRWAGQALELLDRLLQSFGLRYERLKRDRGGLDFEDLELLCRELLRSDEELRDRYRQRFERVMVDELQDTNAIQLELIELIAEHNLFTVGDAQQSIYGFRHADVELFERRGEGLAATGARATLQTNFRSRAEILSVINRAFASELGDRFVPLRAGREEEPGFEPRVELLIADKEAGWSSEGLAAPWRVAEARALAARVRELISSGAAPSDVVVLIRATTDMRAYEAALEERGVPTYTVGGRGYWSHPQVVDLLAYLRALANPRDEEAVYAVLGSPLVGASPDALVLLAAAARRVGRDPWWVLRDPCGLLDAVPDEDRRMLEEFTRWMAAERRVAARTGVEDLIEHALDRTGYDLTVLAMPGGQRRLANVRKLMRLGREHFADHGPDLRGFLDLVRIRSQSWRPDPDQSEAPVASEALEAVRVMTIHRAKGLEFEIVCVADLGRSRRVSADLLRIARDGRIGLRLARPGTGRREPALAYEQLGLERRAIEAREERRLFYVAMTRARERLILSGAAKLDGWGVAAASGAPMTWLGPALVPEIQADSGITDGVRYTVVRPSPGEDGCPAERRVHDVRSPGRPELEFARSTSDPRPSAPITSLSYTSLAAYHRCGYRFYVERLLGVPGTESRGDPSSAAAGLSAAERGTAVHALLERLDFRRPVVPDAAAIAAMSPRPPTQEELDHIAGLVRRFAGSELCARLGRGRGVLREQRFGFLLDDALITGTFDVTATERGGRTLIVDYKTDRLEAADPADVVVRNYATQRLVYALAGLRQGTAEVEVVHVFLEAPDQPIAAVFGADQAPALERELRELSDGLLRRRSFTVSETPHRQLCSGCPAERGLCSWPLAMTRREAPDRLC
jgi:ATP-dependent exoDNAse (exonuclease V) beta subunit